MSERVVGFMCTNFMSAQLMSSVQLSAQIHGEYAIWIPGFVQAHLAWGLAYLCAHNYNGVQRVQQ